MRRYVEPVEVGDRSHRGAVHRLERLDHRRRRLAVGTQRLIGRAAHAQRAVVGLPDDIAAAHRPQMVDVVAVLRAGDHMEVGETVAGIADQPVDLLAFVERHDQDLRPLYPSARQQIGPGCIAVIGPDPVFLEVLQMLAVVVDHRGAVPRGIEHAIDDSADAPAAGDDDRIVFGDRIGFAAVAGAAIGMGNEPVVEDEEQRGGEHGQGHDQQQQIGQSLVEHRIGHREGDQDEAELAGLRQAEAEQPERLATQTVDPADRQQHREFGGDGDGCPEQHLGPHGRGKEEVDPRPDGDEEQAQQQALERVDIAFELVAVLAGSQHDTGDEGTERGREADQRHQQRDADHHQQGGGGEQFAQIGPGDVAEQRADGEDPDRDDRRHRADTDERGEPDRHGRGQIDRAMHPARAAHPRAMETGERQQGEQREDRDDGDVLHQQDREAGLATLAAEQVLLAQRLDHDRGRGQRQHHADGERGLPRPVLEQQRDRRDRERRYGNLAPAEPGELAAHRPQPPRLEFEADDEQHHHHAEFGENLERLDIDPQGGEQGRDRHPREQIAEHRAETEAARQRHRHHPRDEDQEGEESGTRSSRLSPSPSPCVRYAGRVRKRQARSHAWIR